MDDRRTRRRSARLEVLAASPKKSFTVDAPLTAGAKITKVPVLRPADESADELSEVNVSSSEDGEDNDEVDDDDDEQEPPEEGAVIEKVLGRRTKAGEKLCFVKWRGYDDDANEWVLEDTVDATLIAKYAAMKKRGRVSAFREEEYDDRAPEKGRRHVTKRRAIGKEDDVEDAEPTAVSSEDDGGDNENQTGDAPRAKKKSKTKGAANGKPVRITKASLLAAKKNAIKARKAERALAPFPLAEPPARDNEPDVSCCGGCSTREYIRAVETGNVELLKACLACRDKIPRWTHSTSPNLPYLNAMYAAYASNNLAAAKLLHEDSGPRVSAPRGTGRASTGYVSRSTFGHAIAKLNESRGNREGNAAFESEPVHDPLLGQANHDDIDTGMLLGFTAMTPETFDYHLLQDQDCAQHAVYHAAASGALEMTAHLVTELTRMDGWGFNELHNNVLKGPDGGGLGTYRKNQILKKSVGNYRITPLELAAINPHTSHMEELYRQLSASENSEPDDRGRTVVHFASGARTPAALAYLLEEGADATKDAKGRVTPLLLAAMYGREQNIQLIMTATGCGADHTLMKNKSRAIHFASQYGQLRAVKVLAEAGAELDAKATKEKLAPLHLAAARGHIEVVRFLLSAGAAIDCEDRMGRQALIHAIKNGHAEIAQLLLEHGADPNAADSSDNTALHYAAGFGGHRIVTLLLFAGANLNATNNWKFTPIMIADMKGHLKIVTQLLSCKDVLVNSRDNAGCTMLHRCLTQCDSRNEADRLIFKIKALLANQADPRLANLEGDTPIHSWAGLELTEPPRWSKEAGFGRDALYAVWGEIFNLFVEAGADINSKNKEGKTPMDIAIENDKGAPQIRHLLQCKADIKESLLFYMVEKMVNLDKMLLEPTDTPDLGQAKKLEEHAKGLADLDALGDLLKKHYAAQVKSLANKTDSNGIPPIVAAIKESIKQQDEVRALFSPGNSWGGFNFLSRFYGTEPSTPFDILVDYHWKAVMAVIEMFISFGASPSCQVQFPPDWKVGTGTPAPVELGYTALHFAAKIQDPVLLQFLVDMGSKTTPPPLLSFVPTPLYLVGKARAEYAPNIDMRNQKRAVFKFESATKRWADTMTILLAAGANPCAICTQDGDTALLKFAREIRPRVLSEIEAATNLIAPGTITPALLALYISACPANGVDQTRKDGKTALMLFIEVRNLRATKLLLTKANVDCADEKGVTSLMYAIATRDNAYLEAILTVPCDLTLRDANGKTALILALSLPSEAMANMLLKAGADCAIDAMDDQMVSAMHSACAQGFSETVRHLVSLGARTEAVDKNHETPLIHAVRSKSRDCISALLAAKTCNVNVQSSDGRWALHLAVENNDWKVVKMLLEAGARTDVQDEFLITPLHVAVQSSKSAVNTSLKIERLLVAAGAPINAADVQGRTPLHIAFVDMKLIPAMQISTVQRAARSKLQALAVQAKRASELRAADLTLKWLQLSDIEATEWLNAPVKASAAKNRAEEAVIAMDVEEPHPGREWTTEIWEGNPKLFKADPIEIISWLLELPGIKVDLLDKFGRTPLHYAAARGSFTATSYLVTRGATVERTDADNNTTLQIGLLYHNVDYCTMLAKLGSHCGGIMCLADGTRVTAFQYSLKHGFMSLAYMIMEKGQQFLDAFRDCLVTGKYHLAVLLLSRASPNDLRSVHKRTKQNVMHILVETSPTDPITWHEYAVEMFDMIKPLGLDLALGDYKQRTPLYLACMRRQKVLVPLLLPQSKGCITTPCTEGRSALSWALTWRNLEILTMLLRDNITLPAENDVRDMTYIHLAVQLGSREILQRLIELNATIDEFSAPVTGHNGFSTPLVLAIASNNAEFVRMLLAAGADPNKASYAEGTAKPPIELAPPVFAALNCAGTEQGVLELLLLAGASANAIHPTTRLSPLQIAAGRTGVVEVLLRYDANVNYIHPVMKRTPFQVALYAVNQGRVDAALKRLFACSPDVNLLDELSGHTVLDHAIIQDNLELLETALKHGARIDNLSRDREPSVVRCARLNRLACLQRLLKEDLDSDTLNASDVHGRTLLHACVAPRLVASFENVEMLQLIMREPCLDTEVKDTEGLRAVELAFAQHSKVMYNAMVQFGAKDVVVTPPAAIPVAMEIDVPTVDVDADAERARQEILALKAEKLKAERIKRAAALGLSLEALEKQEKRSSCSLDTFLQLSSTTANVLFEETTDTPYDVLMNKCDVDKGYYGSNLFYKMQIAHNFVADNYILLTRFGGVGEDGMHQRTPFPNKDACVAEFEKIFKAKTGNAWGAEFHSKPGRYTPVSPSTKVDVPLPEVSFDTGAIPGTRTDAVERFVKIIADIPELSANVSEQDLGISLGSIDHATVQKAQEVLIEISAAVTDLERIQREEVLPNVKMLKDMRNNIVKLSSKFFTLLPTANEPRGGIKPLFNKRDIDAQKLKLANILYVDSASTLLLGAHARRHEIHPVDYILTGLKCDLSVVDRASDSFQFVQEYLHDTRGEGSQYEISNLFAAYRSGEGDRMSKGGLKAQTRMMLWHGTRSSNFLGILSSGLRIAPVGARLSGQMYGAGIYFGDTFQKSVGYAHNHAPGLNGYVCLLLCEVAVGEQPYESEQAEPELEKAPGSAIATKGLGKRGPTGAMVRCEDGVIVPRAPIVQYPLRKNDKGEEIERFLNFNEYIVYDPSQVRIRYVVLARDTSLCFLCKASGWGLQTMEYYRDSRFASSTTDHKIPSTSFGGNIFEQAICQSIMHRRNESHKELWQDHVDRVIEDNKLFEARWSCPTKMEKYDKVCTKCAETLLSDMLMKYADKHRNEAPMAISNRPDCWWGRTCRNQAKMEHAQRTSHIRDAIRKPGESNVFCLNEKNVILKGATLSEGFLRLESGRATAKTLLDLQKPVSIELGTTISAETRFCVALHTQSVGNAREAPLSVVFDGHNQTVSICSADSGELANVAFPEKALVAERKRQFVIIRLTADTLWVQFAAGVARDGHSGTDFVNAVSVKASAVQLCGALNVSVSLLGTQKAVAYDWSMWVVRDDQISS